MEAEVRAADAAIPLVRQRSSKPAVRTAAQPLSALDVPDALLKLATVCALTGLSAATIYRKVAAGDFPKPVRMGPRCTRWKSDGIKGWLTQQTA